MYGTIDTIIYSQTGDQIFVIYMEKFDQTNTVNDLVPAYLVATNRKGVHWQLKPLSYQMSGNFHSKEILKSEVRKFYF